MANIDNMAYWMKPTWHNHDMYGCDYRGMVAHDRDASDWYERERRERREREIAEIIERDNMDRDHRQRAEAARAEEQCRRSELEFDIKRHTGMLFDVTHTRVDRAHACSAAIADRMAALKDKSVKSLEAALADVIKAHATAVKHRDELWRSVHDSLRRQYWSRITEGDRELLAHSMPETQSKIALRDRHTSEAERHVQAGVAKICADAGIADLETELMSRGPDGLSEHASWHGGEKCPLCDANLCDRQRSAYAGAFVGCSTWPNCGFAWSPMWGATTPSVDGFSNMVEVMTRVYEAKSAWRLAREAGIDMPGTRAMTVDECDDAQVAWSKVLHAADAQGRVKRLLDIALIKYPAASSPQGRRMAAAWQSWKHGRTEAEPTRAKENEMPADKIDHTKVETEVRLCRLSSALANLYTLSEAASLCRSAGMDSSTGVHMADLGDGTRVSEADGWRQLLEQAERQGRLGALCKMVIDAIPRKSDRIKVDVLWSAWLESSRCTDAAPVGMVVEKDKVEESIMTDTKGYGKNTIDGIVETVVTATKDDSADAAWRTAADEALEIGKPVARQIVKEFAGSGPIGKKALSAIDSPIGEGAVAWTMGWAIMGYGPLRGNTLGPKTMRLSKELRVRGLKPITDAIGRKFIRPISKRLTTLIEGLPSLVGEG